MPYMYLINQIKTFPILMSDTAQRYIECKFYKELNFDEVIMLERIISTFAEQCLEKEPPINQSPKITMIFVDNQTPAQILLDDNTAGISFRIVLVNLDTMRTLCLKKAGIHPMWEFRPT